MTDFALIPDHKLLIKANGVYTIEDLYSFENRIYYQKDKGFVRLLDRGHTTVKNALWYKIDKVSLPLIEADQGELVLRKPA